MTTFGQPKPLASLSSTLLARKGQARPAMRPQGFGGFGAIPGAQDDLGWNDMGHPDGHGAEPAYAPPAAVPPVLRQREALQEEFEAPLPVVRRAIELEPSYEYEPADEPEDSYEPEPAYEAMELEPEPAAEVEPEPQPQPESQPEPMSVLAVRTAKPAPVAPAPASPVPVSPAAISPAPISSATAARIGRETLAKQGKAAFTLRLDQERHLRLRLASALHNCSAQVLVTQALDSFLHSLPEVEELVRQLPPRATR
ncbi:MAG: procyclic acidic repetitive family protein [Candidatus Sphingomonas phytovorans]|nr:procyclic acidic repetitive family protein [Sphingomonas sp.]WEK01670.1 MAG: procyclic acidic repetitive family protein [Sphingomonas sp.]